MADSVKLIWCCSRWCIYFAMNSIISRSRSLTYDKIKTNRILEQRKSNVSLYKTGPGSWISCSLLSQIVSFDLYNCTEIAVWLLSSGWCKSDTRVLHAQTAQQCNSVRWILESWRRLDNASHRKGTQLVLFGFRAKL